MKKRISKLEYATWISAIVVLSAVLLGLLDVHEKEVLLSPGDTQQDYIFLAIIGVVVLLILVGIAFVLRILRNSIAKGELKKNNKDKKEKKIR